MDGVDVRRLLVETRVKDLRPLAGSELVVLVDGATVQEALQVTAEPPRDEGYC
jgi:hypothetical protein